LASYNDFLYMAQVLVSRPDNRLLEQDGLRYRECVDRFGDRVIEAALKVCDEEIERPFGQSLVGSRELRQSHLGIVEQIESRRAMAEDAFAVLHLCVEQMRE
jgi:hypothetical protein